MNTVEQLQAQKRSLENITRLTEDRRLAFARHQHYDGTLAQVQAAIKRVEAAYLEDEALALELAENPDLKRCGSCGSYHRKETSCVCINCDYDNPVCTEHNL